MPGRPNVDVDEPSAKTSGRRQRRCDARKHVAVANRRARNVDLVDVGENEVRAMQLLADRRDDVPHLELARRHLGQHRREKRVVLAAEQHDLGFVRAKSPLQPPRDGDPGESAAHDHDDRHATAVEETHMTYLSAGIRRTRPSLSHLPNRSLGGAADIGAILAAAVAFLFKFKFLLLFGVETVGAGWTFLLSLWIYVAFFGWKLAVVVMLLLLAHELGHYFAFRAYGLPVRFPPSSRCSVRSPPAPRREDLEQDAYIALAGPLTGLGLAAVCYGIGMRDATIVSGMRAPTSRPFSISST